MIRGKSKYLYSQLTQKVLGATATLVEIVHLETKRKRININHLQSSLPEKYFLNVRLER
jgi:hypothetical protein